MVDYSTAAWIKIILALVIAFVISFIATPLVKNFAVKVGAIDIPDKKRHIHSHPIPRMGGLAIFIGFLISVLLFANITTQVRGILVGAILIAVVGAIDDVLNLNAWLKFGVQILAAVIAVLSGIIINVVTNPLHITSSQAITIGILSVPVTILWIVGCTNSVNLIDGLDGLACGVSAIASLTMLVVSMLVSDSNSNVATILAALCGACLGFIPYNLNPAKIFMGDTGALLLGYILATASVIGMFKFLRHRDLHSAGAGTGRPAFGHHLRLYPPHPARSKPVSRRQKPFPPQAARHGSESEAGSRRFVCDIGDPRPCRRADNLEGSCKKHPRRHRLCDCRVHLVVRVQAQQKHPSPPRAGRPSACRRENGR